jgi:uncharacterized membrane protein YkoI
MKISMKRIALVAALILPLAVQAADLSCSIKEDRMSSKSQLRSMAKVTGRVAMKAALEKVAANGAIIHHGGLEVEDGCLVYTYDIKVPNRSGFLEVFIDAGTGDVLKVDFESAEADAAERSGFW